MKWLLVLALVGLAWALWRNRRGPDATPRSRAQEPSAQDMVRCHVCQLHLPQTEALTDDQGRRYCCEDHRRSAGS